MGYLYGPNGRCCDVCGESGRTTISTCPHKVTGSSLQARDRVTRPAPLPWCRPPALCATCLAEIGGRAKVHAACREQATAAQERHDIIEAHLEAGEFLVVSAVRVDPDTVRAQFWGRTGDRTALIPKVSYEPSMPMSAYAAPVIVTRLDLDPPTVPASQGVLL